MYYSWLNLPLKLKKTRKAWKADQEKSKKNMSSSALPFRRGADLIDEKVVSNFHTTDDLSSVLRWALIDTVALLKL